MGTLLNRRRYMGGEKPLPYDSEVAYLDKTNVAGSTYIYTGVDSNENLRVVAKFAFTVSQYSSRTYCPFGVCRQYGSGSGLKYYDKFYFHRNHIGINASLGDNTYTLNYTQPAVGTPIEVDFNYIEDGVHKVKVDNDVFDIEGTLGTTGEITLFALRRYRANTEDILDGYAVRLYSCKMYLNDVLVRDFIPVRKGTVGYMYDKVTKKLFENTGSVALELGPDIIMTQESNPEVLAVCYAQGWCASEDYMTLAEAAAVTNNQLGGKFRATNIVHFDEFQYFTGITSLTYNAFLDCQYLKSIKLPYGITTLNNLALSNTALKEIELPDSVTTLGNNVLSNCTSLIKAKLSPNISSSMQSLFANDTNLVTVIMDKNMPMISTGTSSFANCSRLKSIIVPESVTSINHYFAQNCSSLESVMVYPTTPPSLSKYSPFAGSTCPIYVPAESVDAYKTASDWGTYASRIQAMPT